MKKEKLEDLRKILNSLDEKEVAVLRDYLLAFDNRSTKYKPKTVILLDLMTKYDDLDKVDQLFKKKIKSSDARRMVVHRLKEKINECLLLDVNIKREGAYDEISQVRVDLYKMKISALIYLSRGVREETLRLYNKAIRLAEKFEYYDQLIDVLNYKQEFLGLKYGRKEFNKLSDEIAFYEKCRIAAIQAKKSYYEMVMNYGFKGLNRNVPDKKYLRSLEEKLEKLRADYEQTKSAHVGYFFFIMQIEYYQVKNEIEKASEFCYALIEIVKNNPSIYMKRRLGTAYLNTSQNKLFEWKFKTALEMAQKGIPHYKAFTTNYNAGLELSFFANFYLGNIDAAGDNIRSLIENSKVNQGAFRHGMRNYWLACVQFVQKQYGKANLLLQDTRSMDKDKEGYNIHIRVLTILIAIEQENFDFADSQISNLRQFVNEARKRQDVRQREQVIVKTLLELRKASFFFDEAAEKNPELLEDLHSSKTRLAWEIQSPELIPFHQWFEAKLNGKRYEPAFTKEEVFGVAVKQ